MFGGVPKLAAKSMSSDAFTKQAHHNKQPRPKAAKKERRRAFLAALAVQRPASAVQRLQVGRLDLDDLSEWLGQTVSRFDGYLNVKRVDSIFY